MPACPACAGTRVRTGPASGATGRQITACRDCGVHYWADHEAAERQEAIELQTELTAEGYSDWVDIKREQAGPEAWRDAITWIRNALPKDAGRGGAPVIYDVGAGDGHFLSLARDEGGFAVLLEDTDDMGALLVTKRFGESIEALEPGCVVRAGVACYPAHGMTARELLDRADEALQQARRWRQHRIEVARSDH